MQYGQVVSDMCSLHQIFPISSKLHYEQDVMPYVVCGSLITDFMKQDNEINVSLILLAATIFDALYNSGYAILY